jgi:hypothetical protein
MRVRRALVIAGSAGLVAGIVAGVFVWRAVADEAGPATTAATATPTTAATTTTSPVWVSPRETRIGPAVFLPLELEIEGSWLVLSFEMAGLAPQGGEEPDPLGHVPAAPAEFTLRWTGGEVSERVVAPSNRAVRFPIPDDFALGTIREISIDSYWVAAPVRLPIALPRDGGAWEPIGPGLAARIHQVVEQAEDFLVIVELDGPGALMSHMAITGAAREWASSSSSMMATPRWTLAYRGETLPEPIPLTVVGLQWIELESAAPVAFTELLE